MQNRKHRSSHDDEVAGVDVGVAEGKHRGEVVRVRAHAVEA
jgi:hypothetical protein